MADRMLMISWGATIPGREVRALEVFNASLGMYGQMQQQGRIESFDVTLMMPNAMLDGYVTLRGTAAQVAAVKEDAEFRRMCADATLIVERFHLTDGFCDEGVAEQLAMYQEAIAKVPQHA